MDNKEPVTVEQLTTHLFGNRFDPNDAGIIGTMQAELKEIKRRVTWMLVTFIIALITLIVDLISRVGGYHLT